ncbi:MAG: hypothetical protein LBD44_04185 [Spirochaetaceae bacterium]|nr:hypothetical protein [Spirochaetaceae bacterium]
MNKTAALVDSSFEKSYTPIMRRYNLTVTLLAIIALVFSCAVLEAQHTPTEFRHQFESEVAESVEPAGTVEPVVTTKTAEFDPSSITPEVYEETKHDIFRFIDNLNSIIKDKRYSVWMQYLDTEYYQYINSPDYLRGISKAKILTSRKIVLSDAYDYFIHVVVPSRSNDKVDDIEFLSENRVKAINIYNGRRVILYDLEKTQSGWKIVMPNSMR